MEPTKETKDHNHREEKMTEDKKEEEARTAEQDTEKTEEEEEEEEEAREEEGREERMAEQVASRHRPPAGTGHQQATSGDQRKPTKDANHREEKRKEEKK